MEINAEMTKPMTQSPNGLQRDINVKGQKMKPVISFTYLGELSQIIDCLYRGTFLCFTVFSRTYSRHGYYAASPPKFQCACSIWFPVVKLLLEIFKIKKNIGKINIFLCLRDISLTDYDTQHNFPLKLLLRLNIYVLKSYFYAIMFGCHKRQARFPINKVGQINDSVCFSPS